MSDRAEILEDEFVRPKDPGFRELSTGILKLCRKLRLNFALPKAQQAELDAEARSYQIPAAAWLLDERHSLEQIKRAADLGWERFVAEILADYEFDLAPEKIIIVQAKIDRTNAAIEQALYQVRAKPGGTAGPAPPGN